MKNRVLSGIRATGRLHLGNYLGAVKGMIELANREDYETLYMVADAHTITTPYKIEDLRENRKNVVADYLACGLDPNKSIIFIQSEVSQHFELAFYLSSLETVARMRHLPTFKDKVKQYPENVTMALLNYPILMAADILLYKANSVPVGVDQEPHLEVAREIARKMNDKYKASFPEPQTFKTKGEYVPSLLGEGKMSKSVNGSYINLTDSFEVIKEKIAKIPTDGGKGESVPDRGGVKNLFDFVGLFLGEDQKRECEKKYLTTGIRYGELKEDLSKEIYKQLMPIQEKRKEIIEDENYLDEVIVMGRDRAVKIAEETMVEVREKMGIR